jgi:hypothetical protein
MRRPRPRPENGRQRARLSFSMSFHLALLGPTGVHWLDDPPDLTCNDSTRQYAVDDPRLSCKQQVRPWSDWLVAGAN